MKFFKIKFINLIQVLIFVCLLNFTPQNEVLALISQERGQIEEGLNLAKKVLKFEKSHPKINQIFAYCLMDEVYYKMDRQINFF